MTQRNKQWLAVAGGIALIIIYSVVMIATEGASPWAWLLLFAGIALLFASRRVDEPPAE